MVVVPSAAVGRVVVVAVEGIDGGFTTGTSGGGAAVRCSLLETLQEITCRLKKNELYQISEEKIPTDHC